MSFEEEFSSFPKPNICEFTVDTLRDIFFPFFTVTMALSLIFLFS